MSEFTFKRTAFAGPITVAPWTGPLPGEPEKKPSQWIDRARQAWPKLKVVGDGQFYFVSKCEGVVNLFKTIDEARARRCEAGALCDPIRPNHERGKIKYVPPMRPCWEKD